MQTDHHTEIALRLNEKRHTDEVLNRYADICQMALHEWSDMRLRGPFLEVLKKYMAEHGMA